MKFKTGSILLFHDFGNISFLTVGGITLKITYKNHDIVALTSSKSKRITRMVKIDAEGNKEKTSAKIQNDLCYLRAAV